MIRQLQPVNPRTPRTEEISIFKDTHRSTHMDSTAPEKPTRMCASRTKAEYGLNESDLEHVPCLLVRNPYYRSAAPMRLYEVADLEEAARCKAALPTRKELGEMRRKAFREEAGRVAADWAGGSPPLEVSQQGSVPYSVWPLVFAALASDLEVDGVRGISCVARDICRATTVCKDMRLGAQAGWETLRETGLAGGLEGLSPSVDWRRVLVDPMAMKSNELKAVARELGVTSSGTKAETTLRVFRDGFRIQAPFRPDAVPCAEALVWVEEERTHGFRHDGWIKQISGQTPDSAFAAQLWCERNGIRTSADLQRRFDEVSAAKRAREERMCAELRAREERNRAAADLYFIEHNERADARTRFMARMLVWASNVSTLCPMCPWKRTIESMHGRRSHSLSAHMRQLAQRPEQQRWELRVHLHIRRLPEDRLGVYLWVV